LIGIKCLGRIHCDVRLYCVRSVRVREVRWRGGTSMTQNECCLGRSDGHPQTYSDAVSSTHLFAAAQQMSCTSSVVVLPLHVSIAKASWAFARSGQDTEPRPVWFKWPVCWMPPGWIPISKTMNSTKLTRALMTAALQSESTHHTITHYKHCMKNGSIHYRNENNDRLASNLHFSNFPTRHARSRAETTG
jgi:hypothetical protein